FQALAFSKDLEATSGTPGTPPESASVMPHALPPAAVVTVTGCFATALTASVCGDAVAASCGMYDVSTTSTGVSHNETSAARRLTRPFATLPLNLFHAESAAGTSSSLPALMSLRAVLGLPPSSVRPP